MRKALILSSLLFFLNGCVESFALLGSSIGGASSGKMLQSSLKSTVSYGIKKTTGKTPLGHVLSYAEVVNPEKKKETCISFIEKTRSEFCSIVKKKISLANVVIKEKTHMVMKNDYKIKNTLNVEKAIKSKDEADEKFLNKDVTKSKKTPRELAIAIQDKIKNKYKNSDLYKSLASR
tara:strand:- start:485 stop:1015 length:531 start_codon:yes stop_codon:yes gene_type:complete